MLLSNPKLVGHESHHPNVSKPIQSTMKQKYRGKYAFPVPYQGEKTFCRYNYLQLGRSF